MQASEYAPHPILRGQGRIWLRRLEELRIRHPDRDEFRDAAHRMLRWSGLESDVTLYVQVRAMIDDVAG